jgi:thioredoxin reductase
MTSIDTAIIGAGPYGLSIAAHLKAQGVSFRIFGSPMHVWLKHMPKGMLLKSEGFASSLSEPTGSFTLRRYCEGKGIPYADLGLPVARETFISYGLEFQTRFVPELENILVASLKKTSTGFQVALEDGEQVAAKNVVIAVGLSYFAHVPRVLSALPEEFVTHSSRHNDLDHFNGSKVVVVGAGASALDLAALLHQAGAFVQLVARKPAVRFHDPARTPRPLLQRIRFPITGIGPGWPFVFYTCAPAIFRRLPEKTRLDRVKRVLGPAPGWFIRDQVVGKVPFNLGIEITGATIREGTVDLEVSDAYGVQRTLSADHIIAATGYRVDLRRLTFLDSEIQADIRSVEHTPVLSSNFEASVPGLYFVGTSAANAFGPLMRFAFGAQFAARRLSRHLAKSASHSRARVGSASNIQAVDRG